MVRQSEPQRPGISIDDNSATIAHIKRLVSDFVEVRNWQDFHNPKDLAAAIAVEAAELQELLLWKSPAEVVAYLSKSEGLDEVRAELADILILCCSLANRLAIDISAALVRKLAENEAKYPVEWASGRADKYTALGATARDRCT